MTQRRRPAGSGSIFFRSRDAMWIGYIYLGGDTDGRRRKKHFSSRSRDALVEKMRAVGFDPDATHEFPSRADNMALARALGTHTTAEWYDLCKRSPRKCPYCDVQLTQWNDAKDHRVPVSRGGSDGIENLERICWQCNLSKSSMRHDEYVYTGPTPRPFRPSPLMEHSWLLMEAAR